MEPPPDAVKTGRFYEWHPRLHVPEVLLRQSAPGGEWLLCADAECRPLSRHLPGADPVRMAPCPLEYAPADALPGPLPERRGPG